MQTIYEPKGRAKEYAPLALNLYESCSHGCRYCYAAGMALRFGRAKTKDEWHGRPCVRRDGVVTATAKYTAKHRGDGTPVLMCFTCDPYPPDADTTATRHAIQHIGAAGYTPIILTKGGTRAVRDFDILKAAGGWFGQTIGMSSHVAQRHWEPNAADVGERWEALRAAQDAGIPWWISVEPVMDAHEALRVLRTVSFYTIKGHVKLGKLNGYDAETRAIEKGIDWAQYREDACAILNEAGYQRITEPGVFEAGTYYVKAELEEAV